MAVSNRSPGRIFINYRRDDTGGSAGRLSDSLTDYFGPERVFRDVDGIAAGANFEEVLHRTAQDADAMIVLIGRQWARITDDNGQVRLHDPNDWVAREIAAGLQRGIPIYPVLVESAVMPRADELPPALKPLARYNAISISDQRWASDVVRLARIVAIDIPGSLAERTLATVQWVVSLALVVAIALPAVLVALDHFQARSLEQALFSRAMSGFSFVVISACVAVLLFFARLVDPSSRGWIHAAAAVGLAGTLGAFLWVGFGLGPAGPSTGINHPKLPMLVFACSTVTAAAVLALMNLSRFKAR
jgi:hypothetical protein